MQSASGPVAPFPRLPDPLTPPQPGLSAALLSSDDVLDMHRLLGVALVREPVAGRKRMATIPRERSSPQASYSGKAHGAGSDDEGGADDASCDPRVSPELVAALLRVLGLDDTDAAELCRCAFVQLQQ